MLMPYMLTLWAFSVLKPMATHLRSLIILSAPGVGDVHVDMMRNITGSSAMGTNAGILGRTGLPVQTGAFALGTQRTSSGEYSGTSGYDLTFDAARVVPTGAANKPRAWGALACCYLGTPAA